MGKDLNGKSLPRLIKGLEDQGVRTRGQSGGGWMIYFPDGSATTLHRSTSDVRAIRNFRASVRRAGLTWPFDRGFKPKKNSA